jgi:hypothetical protein
MIRSKECDAFGPWIYEINDEHTIPRLFAPYYKQKQTPLMIFKIPINMERRNATPSMHLYDSVVALFDTYLYVMQKDGKNVIENTIAYSDIEAIRYSHELLLGMIYFFVPKKIISIRYNTVSGDIIEKMAAVLTEKIPAGENAVYQMDSLPYSIRSIEFLFSNLIDGIRRLEPSVKFTAYQPTATVKRKIGALHFLKIWMKLQCTAFLVKPAEMIVIERLKRFRLSKGSDYSYSFLRMPYHAIKNIHLREDEDDNNFYLLKIATSDHEFSFLFEKNNSRLNTLYHKMRGAADML